ncbi:carbohydrate esterase family 4 protein [Pisolithus sp. B1]|nr:carbohydrate esterase family 4 protein [Pisolithus sp. B1]
MPKETFHRAGQWLPFYPMTPTLKATYQSIEGSIPKIPPKGRKADSVNGNFGGYKYNSNDPDCWWTYSMCTTPNVSGIPDDIAAVPEPNTLGYGFDDGPNCSHNAFYDYLLSNDQKATMFYIGSNVQQFPLEAQRALVDGHQICVLTALTNAEAFAELWYIVGVTPTCWRPPYGDVDNRIRAIANALGLMTIMWQFDSEDWLGIESVTKVNNNYMDLITAAQNGTFSTSGTIMLTHELTNFTMSEAVNFYDQVASAFSYLVPVGVALNVTAPYVEDGYTLPSFEEYIGGMHVVSATGSSGGDNSVPSVGGSSDGSGSSGSTTTGNSTNTSKSGAAKVSLDRVGSFASAVVLVAGIQFML